MTVDIGGILGSVVGIDGSTFGFASYSEWYTVDLILVGLTLVYELSAEDNGGLKIPRHGVSVLFE